jgi:3-isopropylmalate dehydrogenase
MIIKRIAVLPGDGDGPDVVREAIRVLQKMEKRLNIRFEFHYDLIGKNAIEITGDALPRETVKLCKNSDATLVGAVEDNPEFEFKGKTINPSEGLTRLKKAMGLFCNVRPVQTYPSLLETSPLKNEIINNIDLVIFRELTGGFYNGEKGRRNDERTAYDVGIYNENEIYRISKLALKAAASRKNKLALVDKAGKLETSKLWREVVSNQSYEYPEVHLLFLEIEEAIAEMIQNPAQFDVILTENMFGDILTRSASAISGTQGLLPSASYGISSCLLEPINRPCKFIGTSTANAISAILSAAMLLDYFDQNEAAESLRNTVYKAIEKGVAITGMNSPNNSLIIQEVGNFILANI